MFLRKQLDYSLRLPKRLWKWFENFYENEFENFYGNEFENFYGIEFENFYGNEFEYFFNAITFVLVQNGVFLLYKVKYVYVFVLSRSKDIVEPLIKPQWYVNCQEMAADAVKVSWVFWLNVCKTIIRLLRCTTKSAGILL